MDYFSLTSETTDKKLDLTNLDNIKDRLGKGCTETGPERSNAIIFDPLNNTYELVS